MGTEQILMLINVGVAITTGFLAISTFIAARATKKAAEATERTIEAQYQPWVVMYLRPNWQGSFLDIVVKNVGYGPAYDISFQLPEFFPCDAEGVEPESAKMPKNWVGGPFRNGMSYLAPHEEWHTMWGQYGGLLVGLGNKPVEIRVRFKKANGEYAESLCVLDIHDFAEFTTNNYENSALKEFRKQANAIVQMSQTMTSINNILKKGEQAK